MTIVDATKVYLFMALVVQLALMKMYLGASRRHRQKGFLILFISSIFGTVFIAACSAQYFVHVSSELVTNLYRVGLLFSFPYLILVVIGIRSIIKAYDDAASTRLRTHEKS